MRVGNGKASSLLAAGCAEFARLQASAQRAKISTMQSYLFIGGNQDGLNVPTPDGAEAVQLPLALPGQETYNRSTLSVTDASITVYVHESLTPEQVLNQVIQYYKAWAANRPGR